MLDMACGEPLRRDRLGVFRVETRPMEARPDQFAFTVPRALKRFTNSRVCASKRELEGRTQTHSGSGYFLQKIDPEI